MAIAAAMASIGLYRSKSGSRSDDSSEGWGSDGFDGTQGFGTLRTLMIEGQVVAFIAQPMSFDKGQGASCCY